jgi:hypothetical protein
MHGATLLAIALALSAFLIEKRFLQLAVMIQWIRYPHIAFEQTSWFSVYDACTQRLPVQGPGVDLSADEVFSLSLFHTTFHQHDYRGTQNSCVCAFLAALDSLFILYFLGRPLDILYR